MQKYTNKESKAVALKAQQAAIKEEASANNLSDTSRGTGDSRS